MGEAVDLHMLYRNHRGVTAWRRVSPSRVWFGATEWHPEPQWLLRAQDQEKNEPRDFALADVLWMGRERPSGEVPEPPVGSADAMAWAESFVAHAVAYPGIPRDVGTMVAWFANAMMAERDRSIVRLALERCERAIAAVLDRGRVVGSHHELRACYLEVRGLVVDEDASDAPPMPRNWLPLERS